jgi:excisionase family DNA binding protein
MELKNETGGLEVDILTVHEVARYLRLSEAKVYKLAKQSSIPAIRFGKTWRFRKDLLDEWMRKETTVDLKVSK